jgi:hypothetical protein
MSKLYLVLTFAVCLLFAVPAQARSTRACGNVTVALHPFGEGEAYRIFATAVSCRRARTVAASCVRGRRGGWLAFSEPLTDTQDDQGRTRMTRGQAVVTFRVVGGGGCTS